MKINQNVSFRGYSTFPHYLLLAIKEQTINPTTLGWLVIFLSMTSFDSRNPKTYGCINKHYSIIGNALNINPTTVSRQVEKLIKANLIEFHPLHSLPTIKHYWMFDYRIAKKLSRIKFPQYQEIENIASELESLDITKDIAKMQEEIANLPNYPANLQPTTSKTPHQSFNTLIRESNSNTKDNKETKTIQSININSNREIGVSKVVKIDNARDPNCSICNPSKGISGSISRNICKNCEKEMDETAS